MLIYIDKILIKQCFCFDYSKFFVIFASNFTAYIKTFYSHVNSPFILYA